MFTRSDRNRATFSGCLARSMELKRSTEQHSPDSPDQTNNCIQEKIDFEIRMREGICRLLAVSSQKDQVLHAVKNLMTCNSRIQAYMSEQHMQMDNQIDRTGRRSVEIEGKEHTACTGKVAISAIRIPLMWKDTDHFSNKESSQRYAVFCMFKMGAEIFDTDMVIVDKAVTDICFENVIVFKEARPDFQLKLEVYSCCIEDPSVMQTPRKLVRKLRTSIGKSAGNKLNLEGGDPEGSTISTLSTLGVKYSLLAHITLTLDSAGDAFTTHNLIITGSEISSFRLPLYGSMCCRLVAQPAFMTEPSIAAFLNQQQTIGGQLHWKRLYCLLQGGNLFGYYTPEEIVAKVDPALTVPVNKETRIRAVDKDARKNSFSVINPESGEAVTQIFVADDREELQRWMEAFWQHFCDLSQWKHCAEELMKIEIMSPRKPPLFSTKKATSVYHDMSIGSPLKLESLTDGIHNKAEERSGQFLISQPEESAPVTWAAFFDGTQQFTVQKNVDSLKSNGDLNLNDVKGKKRRAPPPPLDKPPYSLRVKMSTDQSEKENMGKNPSIATRTSSFDTKLSTIMHHLQKPLAAPRKLSLPRKSSATENKDTGNSVIEADESANKPLPIPFPRQKSIKEKLDPRSWIQSQV
ncbi:rhotekin-2 [Microcaecilia unicolor]|uniref:Rhotekin-2 n=1 Tax=Microcaecilia unicolor TaxID=1415580 RepID=A0A6P7Y776_9AMPH|nr:rhotekin-2 [Microcaecilia unicolor]